MFSINELECLRCGKISFRSGNAMDIPCVETSDPERLCKHPVVSVSMITYNHEPYIRQAIEGVMMQKTDFEFELVIGEDCSTDSTREICFEYQKRYPDKIRVLWCDHNLYRNQHPAGGNTQRNLVRCRGEFIALCEGDDYWIDPLKLQKQVDAMRANPSVGLCFCGAKTHFMTAGVFTDWDGDLVYKPGIIEGRKFAFWYIFGGTGRESFGPGQSGFLMTASLMLRAEACARILDSEHISKWRLALGDAVIILGMASISDIYFLPDKVSVYRQTATGVCNSNPQVGTDCLIVRWYFAKKMFDLEVEDTPPNLLVNYYWAIINLINRKPWRDRIPEGVRILKILRRARGDSLTMSFLIRMILMCGCETEFAIRCASWWLRHIADYSLKHARYTKKYLELRDMIGSSI